MSGRKKDEHAGVDNVNNENNNGETTPVATTPTANSNTNAAALAEIKNLVTTLLQKMKDQDKLTSICLNR